MESILGVDLGHPPPWKESVSNHQNRRDLQNLRTDSYNQYRISEHLLGQTYLVKFGIIASNKLVSDIRACRKPSFEPEPGVVASFIITISESKIRVLSLRVSILGHMLACDKWNSGVQESVESNQVAHRGHRVIEHDCKDVSAILR
jgi:hypothetical protein